MKVKQTPWSQRSPEELEAEVKKYDEPFVAMNEAKPLTPKDRELHRLARRRRRPQIGKGAKRVLITLEGGLLKDLDAYAKQNGVSRSQLIAQSVRSVISKRAG